MDVRSSAAACFDQWAAGYDQSALQAVLYDPIHQTVLRRVASLVPQPRRVLDLGCGTGRLLRAAQSRFPRAHLLGVDPCAPMLAAAAAARTPARFVRATAEYLPFGDAVFDVVTATFTVRHWNDQVAAVSEVARILTRGGVFAVATLPPVYGSRLPRHRMARYGLSASVRSALAAAALRVLDVEQVAGAGPISAVTLLLAGRSSPS